ncbi:hypothetical protein PMIN03_007985 [Paraphaeosphaeria minitans]|uniref:Uncharacterized protein n=1 Tax=Paraphaeosphaeria minitans TaxID=565426 RepID=A0A9P6GFA0_9PLEO|nr:hypothetical protein PMIN01_07126 [Paraphaeosphaeria minitans]
MSHPASHYLGDQDPWLYPSSTDTLEEALASDASPLDENTAQEFMLERQRMIFNENLMNTLIQGERRRSLWADRPSYANIISPSSMTSRAGMPPRIPLLSELPITNGAFEPYFPEPRRYPSMPPQGFHRSTAPRMAFVRHLHNLNLNYQPSTPSTDGYYLMSPMAPSRMHGMQIPVMSRIRSEDYPPPNVRAALKRSISSVDARPVPLEDSTEARSLQKSRGLSLPTVNIPEIQPTMLVPEIEATIGMPDVEPNVPVHHINPTARIPAIEPTAQIPKRLKSAWELYIENKAPEEIIQIFIDNWNLAIGTSRKKIRPRPINNPLQEWNPSLHGYPLTDLDLPSRMLIDCVFDPRHFSKEDITDIQTHKDPLVEHCLTLARVHMMVAVHFWWRIQREEDDALLQAHLNLLAKFYEAGAISPFPPLARYLDKWIAWCKRGAGQEYTRPKISKDGYWVSQCGARRLQSGAEEGLKELLGAKCLVRPLYWEGQVRKRFLDVRNNVKYVMSARGSPFMFDTEDLELAYGTGQGFVDDGVNEEL